MNVFLCGCGRWRGYVNWGVCGDVYGMKIWVLFLVYLGKCNVCGGYWYLDVGDGDIMVIFVLIYGVWYGGWCWECV